MINKLNRYVLSIEADADLEEIFDYTNLHFGEKQAVAYLMDLEAVFNQLILEPEIGRKRKEIKEGLFSITQQKHVIFYRILEDCIRVVRVLHGRKDLPRNFKNE